MLKEKETPREENFQDIEKKRLRPAQIVLRMAAFAVLFVAGVYGFGELLKPVQMHDNAAVMVQAANELEEGEAEVFFAGTSHMEYSISPMRIYENTGIVTCGVGTGGQPLDVSFYMAQKAVKKGARLFVLDASNLFVHYDGENYYRYVLDSEEPSAEKWEMANLLVENQLRIDPSADPVDEWVNALVPLVRYHDRWDELTQKDFVAKDYDYYLQGYMMMTYVTDSGITTDRMNEAVETMVEDTTMEKVSRVGDGDWQEESCEWYLYHPEIPKKSLECLLEMRDYLAEHDCEFLLVKIPSAAYPQKYSSAWPEERSLLVKEMAAEYDIDFLDLLYDADLGIDWSTDSIDGGYHLNYNGMKKVTDYMSDYLLSLDYLTPKEDPSYEEKLVKYQKAERVAELQTIYDLPEYLSHLSKQGESIDIFLAASEDMRAALTEEDIEALQNLGLEYDFENMNERNSYLAVVDRGGIVRRDV